jgi:hypothetical protein
VRPDVNENAICTCNSPTTAKWIASRLNIASILEQMVYDFAVGRINETEIIDFVIKSINK